MTLLDAWDSGLGRRFNLTDMWGGSDPITIPFSSTIEEGAGRGL